MRLFYIFLIAVPISLSCGEAGELKPDTSSDTDPDADTSETAAPPADTADSGVTATDTAGDTGNTGDSGTVAPFDEDGDGYTVIDGDCDDEDPAVHPGADELCDRVDNDCDMEIDEEAVDATASYPDLDADGFGDDRFIDFSCEPPPGYVVTGGDCNDTSVLTYPGATERCDDEDNDCDDEIDEGVMYTWYADSDGDGYGDVDVAIDACDPGPGYVATATDCDDVDPMSHPGAFEICDGIDNDCDGETDDSAIDATDWHPDADTDGYGADGPPYGPAKRPVLTSRKAATATTPMLPFTRELSRCAMKPTPTKTALATPTMQMVVWSALERPCGTRMRTPTVLGPPLRRSLAAMRPRATSQLGWTAMTPALQ